MKSRRKLKRSDSAPTQPLGIEIEEVGRTTVMYVRVIDSKVARTRELEEDVLADYDAAGRLVGFELIGLEPTSSRRILGRIRVKYGAEVPSLRLLDALLPA